MIEKILEYLKPKRKVLLLTHDNPDPDSIASAFALKNLLYYIYKKRCTISYKGIIGRSQNKELVRACQIKMFKSLMLNFSRYEAIILVDSQPGAGNVYIPEGFDPDIIIDHHNIRVQSKKATIKDISPFAGSTSTIVAGYYKKLNILPDKDTATALYYGIKTDTIGTARINTKQDQEMMSFLIPHSSLKKLSKIENPELPRYYYKNLYKAIEKMEIVDDVILCDLGDVRNPDLIAESSDFFLRMREIKWTLVSGSIDGICYFSLRCKSTRKNVGHIAMVLTRGIGSGGGHLKSAGGQVHLGDKKYSEIYSILKERLLNLLAKKEEPEKIII
jgi:nanoRNase/pAp phosphatase (c-di-AMP/oligoRNAs hydrolase)